MASELECYLDRFEGELAVLLVNGEEKIIATSMLPPDTREGDQLLISITRDSNKRDQIKSEISDLQKELQNGSSEQ